LLEESETLPNHIQLDTSEGYSLTELSVLVIGYEKPGVTNYVGFSFYGLVLSVLDENNSVCDRVGYWTLVAYMIDLDEMSNKGRHRSVGHVKEELEFATKSTIIIV
jgi:hypothetical protein